MFQENGVFYQSSTTQLPNCNNSSSSAAAAAALEMELQHQLQIEQCYSNINCGEIQEMALDSSNWQEMMGFNNQNYAASFNQIYAAAAATAPPPPPSLLPNFSQKSPALLASLGLLGDHVNHPSPHISAAPNGAVYDPLNLFHSLPGGGGGGGFTFAGSSNGGFFTNGVDERENGEGGFEFTATDTVKDTKSEKHRRLQMKDKYEILKSLVPNSSKDRASIVADAIVYVNELKRTVSELKGLVEKKRFARERLKRPKIEENGSESKFAVGDVDGSSSLRSSWLRRKSKNTEVDVRIIDDEVTVKLVQQKRINCVLCVSKVLDELQLDLHHVAGGLIGDYYSYLFNSKICEGSMVYASAVADKLIEVVHKQYAAAVPPASSY